MKILATSILLSGLIIGGGLGSIGLGSRYEVRVVENGEASGAIYRIDHWTAEIIPCQGARTNEDGWSHGVVYCPLGRR